jgi:hypothetical protein
VNLEVGSPTLPVGVRLSTPPPRPGALMTRIQPVR